MSEQDKFTMADLRERQLAKMVEALKPFANAVFNDNGDMTVTIVSNKEAYIKAYFALKGCS